MGRHGNRKEVTELLAVDHTGKPKVETKTKMEEARVTRVMP